MKENLFGNIRFDTTIIFFGLGNGEYLKELRRSICDKNKVLIIEINDEIYKRNININTSNINLVLFDQENINDILDRYINILNYDSLVINEIEEYVEIYSKEYIYFTNSINEIRNTINRDNIFFTKFKDEIINNTFSNLKCLNESIAVNLFKDRNNKVPAFIISAGPSLERNLDEMISNKEKIKNSIIIASTRTLKALIAKGINADFIISIDPSDLNYEFIKNNLNNNIPIVFYEYSNRKVINEYKGEKVFFSTVFSKVFKELNYIDELEIGGSVCSTAIDFGRYMGCNPIILVGQDLAYTNNLAHDKIATFNFDWQEEINGDIMVDNIYGEEISTSNELMSYKLELEKYIKNHKEIEIINVSYGAAIIGADHLELNYLFKTEIFKGKEEKYSSYEYINIIDKEIRKQIIEYISSYVKKCKRGKVICELLQKEEGYLRIQDLNGIGKTYNRILEMIDIVNSFESDIKNKLLGSAYLNFRCENKNKVFNILAKDYSELGGNIRYQGRIYKKYFIRLEKMLIEFKKIIKFSRD